MSQIRTPIRRALAIVLTIGIAAATPAIAQPPPRQPGAAASTVEVRYGDWTDAARAGRIVPWKLYLPKGAGPFPVVVHSHGLGGSREASVYILQAVAETGSISAAARQMKMSYRRAWLLIDTMNRCFREPVVDTATGGKGGGGAQITAFGRIVLKEFRLIESRAMTSIAAAMPRFAKLLRKAPPRGKLH